jgi:hypothetical protein
MFRRLIAAATVLLIVAATAAPATAQVGGAGTLKGWAYFDLAKGLSDANDDVLTFAFRRVYFTYDLKMSDTVTGRFRTDVKQDSDGYTRVYIKHAYADWKATDQVGIRAGVMGTIMYSEVEDVWAYRAVAKMMEDEFKVRSSADFGLMSRVKFNDMVSVNAMLANGEGYDKKDDGANRKAYEVQGLFAPIPGLTVSGYFGLRGFDADGDPATTNDQEDATTIDLAAGYAQSPFAVGGSLAMVGNWNGTADQKAQGISGWGRFTLPGVPLTLLAKFDRFDPDTDTDDDQTTYIVAGVDYAAAKGLSIIPNIQQYKVGTAAAETSFLLTFYWKW